MSRYDDMISECLNLNDDDLIDIYNLAIYRNDENNIDYNFLFEELKYTELSNLIRQIESIDIDHIENLINALDEEIDLRGLFEEESLGFVDRIKRLCGY